MHMKNYLEGFKYSVYMGLILLIRITSNVSRLNLTLLFFKHCFLSLTFAPQKNLLVKSFP